ncbi:MAG: histidine ammonia-lyase [Lentisphaeraceae bacterium]|nr:histidine ammonia-lyase [Lentisphaeraceae bacterium]
MLEINLDKNGLSLAQMRLAWENPIHLTIDEEIWSAVKASNKTVKKVLEEGQTVYGINTGFGLLARQRIDDEELEHLQEKLILSHAAGVGKPLEDCIVRLIMLLKINSLCKGYSGVRPKLIRTLVDMFNAQIYPLIPEKGSVGASGDLAPLAHMSLPLIGLGKVHYQNKKMKAKKAFEMAGLQHIVAGPKEGLALLNGTQASTALALGGLFKMENLFSAALVAGALSVDAAKGSIKPFDKRLNKIRGQKGQMHCARIYRKLLKGSDILKSHINCKRVQDPYSLRCQPQVMGACWDQMTFAENILLREANAVSDNPLVFADEDEIISGGNFHAEPVAMAADNLALVFAEVGALSERRIALLIDEHLSNLPPFLVPNGGLNSGFMIAQVTAAALASENKSLAHPACVDSLPTSANQEDHVSMATFAARRLHDMAENTAAILAVELLAACQGIDFRAPDKTSEKLQKAHQMIRDKVDFYYEDRYFSPDIETVSDMVLGGGFGEFFN